MTPPTRRLIGSAVVACALLAGASWLVALGRHGLDAPPLSLQETADWLSTRDAGTVAAVIVRLGALVVALFLLFAVALELAAGLTDLVILERTAARVTPRWLQSLLGTVAAFGLVAAPPPNTEADPSTSSNTIIELPAGPDVATMIPLADDAPAPPPVAPPAAPASSSVDDVWIVEPGDSFWSIARDVLSESLGRMAADDEIAPFWRQMIDANRSRLTDANDADLLLPGQELEVPAAAPGR